MSGKVKKNGLCDAAGQGHEQRRHRDRDRALDDELRRPERVRRQQVVDDEDEQAGEGEERRGSPAGSPATARSRRRSSWSPGGRPRRRSGRRGRRSGSGRRRRSPIAGRRRRQRPRRPGGSSVAVDRVSRASGLARPSSGGQQDAPSRRGWRRPRRRSGQGPARPATRRLAHVRAGRPRARVGAS